MNVLYIISVMGHGRGGHFHSLNQISLALSSSINLNIVTIGPGRSKIIEVNKNFSNHLFFNGFNLFSFRREVLDIILKFKPDIVHCFDNHSYNVIKFLNFSIIKNIVINKCGGPNDRKFPKSENLALFSLENMKWFNDNNRYASTNMFFIPNRVNAIKFKKKDDYPKKPKNTFSFVRITRIGVTYKKSVIDSINLIKELVKTNKVCLFVIGVVENEVAYRDLIEHSKDLPIYFINEEAYTSEASKMLYLADAVIATGRSAMEASSLGLPVLTPISDKNIPALIREDNFDSFFRTNFSPRNVSLISEEQEIEFIEKLIVDDDYLNKIKKFSKSNFNSFFDMEKGIIKYKNMYLEISDKKVLFPWYFDLVLKLKSIKTFYLSSIK